MWICVIAISEIHFFYSNKQKETKSLRQRYSNSKLILSLLNTQTNQVLWCVTQFVIQNVYKNRHLSSKEIIRGILKKEKDKRNLFDIRYLQSSISGNNFFAKMTKEGSFELTYQCLKEFQYHHAAKGESKLPAHHSHHQIRGRREHLLHNLQWRRGRLRADREIKCRLRHSSSPGSFTITRAWSWRSTAHPRCQMCPFPSTTWRHTTR